jgi:pimeloyl-ACP methyl ester carboxylesterase
VADNRPIQPTRAAVTVRGQRIAYQVVGSGEPVVLVHGLAGSTRWWCRNAAALAERHTVYLLNLPGFGAFRGRHQAFSLATAADWLTDWIDAVGIGPCHLVGHSMGGHIAIRVAAHRPDLVRRLVLVAPALVAGRRSVLGLPLAIVAAGWAATPSFLPILTLDTLRAGPLTMLSATRGLFRQDIYVELRRIAAPTLLIWGDRDALVPPAWGPTLQAELPDARLLYLPGAGHVVQYDRAGPFNEATLAFLAGQEPSAR